MKSLNQKRISAINNLFPSLVDPFEWRGQQIYIKRDDLLDTYLSGNKLRKLYHYLHTDIHKFRSIVSYGGMQSNAMLSIARLAQMRGLGFTYYTRYETAIDREIASNYTLAKRLGMQHRILDAKNDDALGQELQQSLVEDVLFIPQGGARKEAEYGIALLADEIIEWKQKLDISELVVAIPSGTGTTAGYLQRCLGPKTQVLTAPVVGDKAYLIQQMDRLGIGPESQPYMIESAKKFPFAKPDTILLEHYQEWKQSGIELDLIYAPVMLQALWEHQSLWKKKWLLYIHSGGVPGNASQLQRYRKKGWQLSP